MGDGTPFFAEVRLNGYTLADYRAGKVGIHDRAVLKDFLEYIHIKKGLLAPYSASYPLVEARELLPSFEKTFAEYKGLPAFSMVAFNRRLSYQQENFQFDLLHPGGESRKRGGRENVERIVPHLARELRPQFRQRLGHRDLTELANYEDLVEYLFRMDRAQVIARDADGLFRLLGVYASFPSDLDSELKTFGCRLGKFKKLDDTAYEREREFVYQFLMELYGFPICAERRTSAALFARKLSRLKEQYLIKVLGSSDRTLTSLCGWEQKRFPVVEKIALIALPAAMGDAVPHLREQGFLVDQERRVVILKVTYQQHKYNPHNVLEDRALSVVKQEIIHPVHGGRELGFNVLKDSRRFLKNLTDIVRGEYFGAISYQRSELLVSTKTHEERLKFLDAWLSKNQRRLATYSSDSFMAVKKVLNSYLLNREYKEAFVKHAELHRGVVKRVVYLNQAHQLQTLEKLAQRDTGKRQLGPYQRLAAAVSFLEEKKEELPYFYPDLFKKGLDLWEKLLSYPYFKRLGEQSTPPGLPYRRRVWHLIVLGRRLMALIAEQHQHIQAEVGQGKPFPLIPSGFPPRPIAPQR